MQDWMKEVAGRELTPDEQAVCEIQQYLVKVAKERKWSKKAMREVLYLLTSTLEESMKTGDMVN